MNGDDCIHCRKEICNDTGWCNSFKTVDGLIGDMEYAVLARSQGLPGSADKLHKAKQAIRDALGVSASHHQDKGTAGTDGSAKP